METLRSLELRVTIQARCTPRISDHLRPLGEPTALKPSVSRCHSSFRLIKSRMLPRQRIFASNLPSSLVVELSQQTILILNLPLLQSLIARRLKIRFRRRARTLSFIIAVQKRKYKWVDHSLRCLSQLLVLAPRRSQLRWRMALTLPLKSTKVLCKQTESYFRKNRPELPLQASSSSKWWMK